MNAATGKIEHSELTLEISMYDLPNLAAFINGKLNISDSIGCVNDIRGNNLVCSVGAKSDKPGKLMDTIYYQILYPKDGGNRRTVSLEPKSVGISLKLIDEARGIFF